MFNFKKDLKKAEDGSGNMANMDGSVYGNMDDSGNFGSMKSGYQNKMPLNPSTLATPSKDALSKQLGKATKLESAYDNLEKVMGSNNIKSMSGDTEKLIAKQGELLKQLKDLTPELNKTIDSVSKLDINGILGSFKGISNSLNENMKNI